MGVSVIEIGRKSDNTKEINALTCKNCGAPLNGNKCEYCGTQYVDNSKELAELEAKQKDLEAELRVKRLEIAQQEQTARLYRLMGMNAELRDIAREMKNL